MAVLGRVVTNGSALSSFTTASRALPLSPGSAFSHKLLADNVPIALVTSRSPRTVAPLHSDSRPNSTLHHLDAAAAEAFAESSRSWNFRESRGDRKIRGGGKYSNHHHITTTNTTTIAAPSIPGLRHILRIPGKLSPAHPSLPFWRKEEGGRRREGGGQCRRWLGAGNLIANTFHSPANFKPISSVYCQSQRARNSSLSVRNEILPVAPFRRSSPCPFDLHWRRLGNLWIPCALALLYLNERSFNAGEIYDGGSRPPRPFRLSIRQRLRAI